MNIDSVVDAAFKLIKGSRYAIAFTEIEKLFEEHGFDFRGDMAISIGIPNVHVWYEWNKDAVEVLMRLQDRGIVLRDESPLTYYYDGLAPNLPLASASNIRRKAGYKEEHWFPASLIFMEGAQ